MTGPGSGEPVECSCCAPAPATATAAEPPLDERPGLEEAPLPSLPLVLAQRASVLVW